MFQVSPNTFYGLFYILIAWCVCCSSQNNPLWRDLLIIPLLIWTFPLALVQTANVCYILELQSFNLWWCFHKDSSHIYEFCRSLWNTSSHGSQNHFYLLWKCKKKTQTIDLSFPEHKPTLLLFIIYDGHLLPNSLLFIFGLCGTLLILHLKTFFSPIQFIFQVSIQLVWWFVKDKIMLRRTILVVQSLLFILYSIKKTDADDDDPFKHDR